MKNLIPVGDYILLKELKKESHKKGELLVAKEAGGSTRYTVVDVSSDLIAGLEVDFDTGDIVYVEQNYMIPVSQDGTEQYFFIKHDYILGYEEEKYDEEL